jgi:hypothetical protein
MEKQMKRLAISFSGGRTSAVMTKLLLERYRGTDTEVSVTFANTGCEHPTTLEFVRKCDEVFGFGTVWMEGVTGPEGVGMRHKVVTFETASRNGEPFQDYISKFGVPCQSHPQCTSRLKEDVMYDYRRSIGWTRGTYKTAIGIRVDEADRCSAKADEHGFVYPLVQWGWNKDMVKAEVAKWPFDLELPGDHYGNCVWCWKKSKRKLLTVAKESPEWFDFPAEMERKYSKLKAENAHGKRVFFRGNESTADILRQAKTTKFTPYSDSLQRTFFEFDDFLDVGSGCGESCEIGADE